MLHISSPFRGTGGMEINVEAYRKLHKELEGKAALVAVSKTKSIEAIKELYNLGHRDFGENYVQELLQKQLVLPNDIRWHFVGHLQRNKVKYLVPFIHLIHSVDSFKLLEELERAAAKSKRTVNCLLQVHIAEEETKFGFDQKELMELIQTVPANKEMNRLEYVNIQGLMGMASFTENFPQVEKEFKYLKTLFDDAQAIVGPSFNTLSMGMSADYEIALREGSNMLRIGTLIFGERGEENLPTT
jgi:PLP dependent protein